MNGMESYQLSLNQVNFEHYHLGEEANSEDQLHSFSNLVCYDMDLKSEGGDGLPVKPKRVNLIKGLYINLINSISVKLEVVNTSTHMLKAFARVDLIVSFVCFLVCHLLHVLLFNLFDCEASCLGVGVAKVGL